MARRTVTILAPLLIAAALFLALEVMLRLLSPQSERMDYIAGQRLARPDAVIGHTLEPGVHVVNRSAEFNVEYRTNSDGVRDAFVHARPRTRRATRILVLGDSFTFGWGVEYEESWPALFERELQSRGFAVEVVKAGVPGYDTTREALYLERLAPEFNPDMVLIGLLPNDVHTNTRIEKHVEYTSKFANPEVRARGEAKSELHSVVLAKRLLSMSDRLYVKTYSLTPRYEYFSLPESDHLRAQIRVSKGLFERIQQICDDHGMNLVVVSIPQQFQVLADARRIGVDGLDVALIDREFSMYASEQGFGWISVASHLVQRYRERGEDLYYRVDGHLNARGHRVVGARVVEEFIEIARPSLERRPWPDAAERSSSLDRMAVGGPGS